MAKKPKNVRFKSQPIFSDGLNLGLERPTIKSKGRVGMDRSVSKKKRSYAKIKAKSISEPGSVLLELPIRTVSEANISEHWMAKHKRHRNQNSIVIAMLYPIRDNITLPCKIHLTRLAPKQLDPFDNLPMSFKYILDAICSVLTGNYLPGRADGDERLSVSCDQEKSKAYGIRIDIKNL